MSLSYLGLLNTVLLSSVGSIITPCNLCEVLPTVTVQCDWPSFYPYSPECVELEFSEVRRRCRLSLISLKPTLKRWPFAVTRTTEEIRADTI
jgi:hypothetical protein